MLNDLKHIKEWCLQSQQGLSGRQVADAVIRMIDATIEDNATQQSEQADACYCCRDGGCQSGCRCQEFVGDAT